MGECVCVWGGGGGGGGGGEVERRTGSEDRRGVWLRIKVIQREDDGRVCVGEKRERERERATILAVSRKTPHKSLAVCWLDLAIAQGSLHHALTHFSFQHYCAPHSSVKPYLNLRDKVTTDEWKLGSYPLTLEFSLPVVIFKTVITQ